MNQRDIEVKREIESLVDEGYKAYGEYLYSDSLSYYLQASDLVISERWNYQTNGKISSLDIGAWTQAGDVFSVVGSQDHNIYILDDNGVEIWKFNTNAWVMGVAFYDINDDGQSEIVAGSDKLYILNNKGEMLYSFACKSNVSSMVINRNNLLNSDISIITGHESGEVVAWDKFGEHVWSYKLPKMIVSVAIADINQDGKLEIAAACEDKNVYILNEYGKLRDKYVSHHWILNVKTADIYGEGERLIIASFEGDVNIYKEKKTATLKTGQHGILGLNVSKTIVGNNSYQIILGSSDKGVSIFDLSGELIWRFNTSYGHRVLQVIKRDSKDIPMILIGAEDGSVHSYNIIIHPQLLSFILHSYSKINIKHTRELNISQKQVKQLKVFVSIEQINKDATVYQVNKSIESGDISDAIIMFMHLWRTKAEYEWSFKTEGRVYALSACNKNLYAGSEDGKIYKFVNGNSETEEIFETGGGVRGIYSFIDENSLDSEEYILVGSTDNNIYLIDHTGIPQWHFRTQDWILYSYVYVYEGSSILVSSLDNGLGIATDKDGAMLWQYKAGARIRSISSADIYNDGKPKIIFGSDDKFIHIVDNNGNLINKFQVPHWVLVIKAIDLNNDGLCEILIGTEDGALYVYDNIGNLIWLYQTDHWVAALDCFRNPIDNSVEIVIGSADRNVYCLSSEGVLNWVLETDARVRSLHVKQNKSQESYDVYFGSYDQNVYKFRVYDDEELNRMFISLTQHMSEDRVKDILDHKYEDLRAFACLLINDEARLLESLNDQSSLVKTASAIRLIESNFIGNSNTQRIITDLISAESSVKNRLLIYKAIRNNKREDCLNLLKTLAL